MLQVGKGRGGGREQQTQRVQSAGAPEVTSSGERSQEQSERGTDGEGGLGEAGAAGRPAAPLLRLSKCSGSAAACLFPSSSRLALIRVRPEASGVCFSGYQRVLNSSRSPWYFSLFAALPHFTCYFFLYFLLSYRLALGILVP